MTLYKRINDFLWSRWWKYRVYFRRFPEEKHGYGLRFAKPIRSDDGGKAAKG